MCKTLHQGFVFLRKMLGLDVFIKECGNQEKGLNKEEEVRRIH